MIFRDLLLRNVLDFYNGKSIKPGGEGIYPVYGSNGIIGGCSKSIYADALIIGRVGAYCGAVQYCKTQFWASDNTIVAKSKDGFDNLFSYYLLSNMDLHSYAGGAAQPLLTQTTIKQLKVRIPPLPTQRRIAEILSAYDNLIENNTYRIHILEQMAQAIYHDWFGKVDKESLPEGWKIVEVGDVCNVGRGSSPRPIVDQKYFEGGTIPWIKIADATKSGKYLYETKEHVNEYGASFSRLLPKGSLILAASGTLGFPQLLGVDGCVHDGWLYINEFDGATRDYLYYLFKSKQVFFSNSAYGAAIQNINTTILREMEITLPPIEVQNKFSHYVSEIDQLLQNIERSNANLRRTRDLLLPRLVSGEIELQ
jgi:type I restriction enzyme S subunit